MKAMQLARSVCVIGCMSVSLSASADDRAMTQLDPFVRATHGDPQCPEQRPPLLTPEEARVEAHVRVERGLRCAMDGSCEAGGAYRRDAEINERASAMIAGDHRFADTSVWVTTTRKWVTLQGCVRSSAQRRALEQLVRNVSNVERVFDELKVRGSHARASH